MLISKWLIELGRQIEKAEGQCSYYVCISKERGLFLCKPADNPKAKGKYRHETLKLFTASTLKRGLTYKQWAMLEDAARIKAKEMGIETYGYKQPGRKRDTANAVDS